MRGWGGSFCDFQLSNSLNDYTFCGYLINKRTIINSVRGGSTIIMGGVASIVTKVQTTKTLPANCLKFLFS